MCVTALCALCFAWTNYWHGPRPLVIVMVWYNTWFNRLSMFTFSRKTVEGGCPKLVTQVTNTQTFCFLKIYAARKIKLSFIIHELSTFWHWKVTTHIWRTFMVCACAVKLYCLLVIIGTQESIALICLSCGRIKLSNSSLKFNFFPAFSEGWPHRRDCAWNEASAIPLLPLPSPSSHVEACFSVGIFWQVWGTLGHPRHK